MVSLGRAVFWWETARFLLAKGSPCSVAWSTAQLRSERNRGVLLITTPFLPAVHQPPENQSRGHARQKSNNGADREVKGGIASKKIFHRGGNRGQHTEA